jgi:hypothetical protein
MCSKETVLYTAYARVPNRSNAVEDTRLKPKLFLRCE